MSASNPIDFKTLTLILPYLKDAVLLRGPHGIGKSAVPAERARTSGMRLLDVRLSLFTEGDLIGVPDHKRIADTGVTTFAPPDWLHTACTEPCILFLDEINRASPGVQNSAFQLVLDREVKGMRLHPETLVFAAINDAPEYSVNEMDPALLDRFESRLLANIRGGHLGRAVGLQPIDVERGVDLRQEQCDHCEEHRNVEHDRLGAPHEGVDHHEWHDQRDREGRVA